MSAAEPYASIDDFRSCGLPAPALANLELMQVQAALLRASRIADTFLRDAGVLPLKCPYDPALTLWVCWIASYMLLSTRGFNPNQAGADNIVVMNYREAIDSLKRVANGQQSIAMKQTDPGSSQPQVGTNPARGFGGYSDGEIIPIVGPNTWGS